MDFQLNLDTDTLAQCYPVEPLCFVPTTKVRDVLRKMKELNRAGVMVCREQVLIGVFTERDAVKMMAAGASFDVPIEQVMTRNPVALHASETVGTAIATMTHGGYRRLPIVDDQGRPTGIITVKGILHYLVGHFPKVIYNLPPKPHYSSHEREGA